MFLQQSTGLRAMRLALYTLLSMIFFCGLWGQERPVIPPSTPLLNNLAEIDAASLPRDLTLEETSSILDVWQVWQIQLTDLRQTALELRVHGTDIPHNARLYLRYPVIGGYSGPYSAGELTKSDEWILMVHHWPAVLEYQIPIESTESPGTVRLTGMGLPVRSGSQTIRTITPFPREDASREEPIILVTGYWPPTNEMVRHFSQNPELNPGGWQGDDWEGRGYDVISYFPSFDPPDCSNCGQGYGDLEVDYQDTSQDYWPIVDELTPIGIITFSRGSIDWSWEMENNYWNRTNWIGDYTPPNQPTPNPPDPEQPAYHERFSTLPQDAIVDAIAYSGLGLNPFIDLNGNAGMFLSEYMGFHGVWYQDLFEYSGTPCIAAGHIHVGGQIDWNTARSAAEITIRELINYLDLFAYTPGDVNDDGAINVQDIVLIVNIILGQLEPTQVQIYAADINTDDIVNVLDVIVVLNTIVFGP